MCGIVGLLDTRGGAGRGDIEAIAKRMADRLRHRGPDAHGTWADGEAGVAFGHRRLSVIDTSDLGLQPMTSADGRYVITYNGEVYNFLDLREELVERGHSFTGGSDTEVMLAAFVEWGVEAAVERLWGMFAFGVWDKRDRKLYLVRDRVGVKPLCWSWRNGVLLFASELTALEEHPAFDTEIDREAVAALVRTSYIPAPSSIYRHAHKLPAGSILVCEAGKEPEIRGYWHLRERIAANANGAAGAPPLDDEAAAERLEELMADSVRRRMVADVPLGAFLSGGIDSSVVVALMQSQSSRRVRTFTIGFDRTEYNEAPHAKAVAEHLGTDHTELYLDESHVLDVVPKLAGMFDEPFADSSQIPTYLISALTREHVTVALSGDGGDEMFAGYPKYPVIERMWTRMGWMPGSVRGLAGSAIRAVPVGVWDAAGRLIPQRRRPQRVGQRAHRLGALLNLPGDDALYGQLSAVFREEDKLVPGTAGTLRHRPDPELRALLPDLVARMQYYDTMGYLPDDI
ncbi:MAG: asparagine synthase (glutamine-hydrolyzing), partial [Rhodospirillaceae bacterium]|nr:asparagine synthase (glutamine-hydrolyzing) [Rhodospirillaceae bacterium]